jgi:hypothetical protein
MRSRRAAGRSAPPLNCGVSRHMKRIAALVSLIAFFGAASAQDSYWRSRDGQPVPDTDQRKSSRGFGGWVIATADADWEAKWNTPAQETPEFAEAHSVRKGQRVFTLIFIGNPLPDSNGEVNVRCHIRVTRPNGSVAVDRRDLPCLQGRLQGNPLNLRLAGITLPFVGEEGDPLGRWMTEITLHDVERDVVLDLRNVFEYVGDG